MRVFLDANILFSASNAPSRIAELVRLLPDRNELVTSDLAAEEARRNVRQKRQDWTEELNALLVKIEIVAATSFAIPIDLDRKDQHILCTAVRHKCSHLATGDRKHFGKLYGQTIEGVTIVSVRQLAELVENETS